MNIGCPSRANGRKLQGQQTGQPFPSRESGISRSAVGGGGNGGCLSRDTPPAPAHPLRKERKGGGTGEMRIRPINYSKEERRGEDGISPTFSLFATPILCRECQFGESSSIADCCVHLSAEGRNLSVPAPSSCCHALHCTRRRSVAFLQLPFIPGSMLIRDPPKPTRIQTGGG